MDTVALIYAIEGHPRYLPLLTPLWEAAKDGRLLLVVSELAISEALVNPFRTGDESLIKAYEAVAFQSGFKISSANWTVLRRAAELRGSRAGLRTPDAIHLATAELERCQWFITNDKSLRSSTNLYEVVVLDDLVTESP